jgi:hypothetical protein
MAGFAKNHFDMSLIQQGFQRVPPAAPKAGPLSAKAESSHQTIRVSTALLARM